MTGWVADACWLTFETPTARLVERGRELLEGVAGVGAVIVVVVGVVLFAGPALKAVRALRTWYEAFRWLLTVYQRWVRGGPVLVATGVGTPSRARTLYRSGNARHRADRDRPSWSEVNCPGAGFRVPSQRRSGSLA